MGFTTALALLLALVGIGAPVAAETGPMYRYIVAADFLCDLAPDACPAMAIADNGDAVELAGAGTFGARTRAADGGGTFVHKDSAGNVLASGTWTATRLTSFKSFGNQPDLPASFEGGLALIHVEIDPGESGGPTFAATLTVFCAIGKVPGDKSDQNELNVYDLINFNKSMGGFNVFIRLA